MFYHHNINNVYCELQDCLEELGVDEKIILNRSSINWIIDWLDRIRRMKRFVEHGEETSSGSVLSLARNILPDENMSLLTS